MDLQRLQIFPWIRNKTNQRQGFIRRLSSRNISSIDDHEPTQTSYHHRFWKDKNIHLQDHDGEILFNKITIQ